MYFVQIRQIQTSAVQRDIDQAAKYIGAGAATVGMAGSGRRMLSEWLNLTKTIGLIDQYNAECPDNFGKV